MGHISFVGKAGCGDACGRARRRSRPNWTLELMAKHSLDFWLTSEDLPDPDNRVTLDRDGKIVLSYTPNNLEGARAAAGQAERSAEAQQVRRARPRVPPGTVRAAAFYVGQRIPLAGVAHQNGTIRFGNDPKTSALDVNCKAHDVDNLYVVDGSFFPSSAAVNPALTIMANALRVGDHILEPAGRECRAFVQVAGVGSAT